MIQIEKKARCSGCSACYNSCPVRAIKMTEDNEGFLYPSLDENTCIKCNICEKVCPYHSAIEINQDLQACFAGYNTNDDDRAKSSSGGIFIALARAIIERKGVVFGSAYDGDFMAMHTYAESYEELVPLIGSKYMQSRIGNTFHDVKKFLDEHRTVMFVGSACQIAGLKKFLQKGYSNLICVDFICLGVPSAKIWRDYITTFFQGEKIQRVNFKDKNLGWHDFSLRIDTDKQKFCKNGRDTLFFSGYFNQLYSRPSCYECIFKNGYRVSDITISDCWGYHDIAPEMDDNKGLSSIVCHTDKGLELFESIKDKLVWKEANIDDVKKYNSNIVSLQQSERNAMHFGRIMKELKKNSCLNSIVLKKHQI